ncbi:MAG: Gfo/Idh/MocA family oxidoreductase [Verrucomicrobiales bacterium]|nr:Gfo/Idh/MocA family oxidoreductase [Verrucomicrobiae bacterium]
MNKVRIGVVGAGAIGENHIRVLSALENAELTAVFESSPERAREIQERYGVPVVDSLDALIDKVDAATVATPTVSHLEVGSRLLRAGRHVLVEKPIADTTEAARELVQLAKDHNRILQVGHVERFNPVLRELEETMSEPRFIEAHRLSPFPNRSIDIGVVLDLMIHDLEIILHLVRSDIESIDAVGVPVLTRREDIANARLRFANGCVANITASRISPERLRKIRVFQSDSYLSLDYMAQEGQIYWKDGGQIARSEVTVEKDEPLKCELESFCECARTGRQPKVSGSEATAALEVAVTITRQIEAANAPAQ